MDRSDPGPPDYGKHAESVIEVDLRSLATFERSERGEVWRGGAREGTGGLTDLRGFALQRGSFFKRFFGTVSGCGKGAQRVA